MKIVIDTKDIESFFATLSAEYDEWYYAENAMTLGCIIDFLEYAGKDKAATELRKLLPEN